ncbi:Gfo/Idh/MocA family oxidoreductase [Arsenicicoccus bolidensis]|uniref:Gfo/Idh/MocA family oxidoreductase n=1 Tax=Arsenicicoccus bolidensis TaxID=229480 RepID=UPI0028A63D25|nr:Gfo/Idh/MocA family oxidoreductase [Arsenicicoccus bolidensis]
MHAVVRGGGSIGARHVEVLRSLGLSVDLWPVRPRPPAAGILDDQDGPSACATADLVVVATDTGRHVGDALAALDAGADRVLVEKPLSPTAADAEPLVRHGRADRVRVAAPLRGHRAYAAVLDLVGGASRPLSAHVSCQSWLPDWRPGRDYRESYSARADEGGVLRDLVHELDYATALLGRPELSWAALDRSGPLEMSAEQAATLAWTTPAGDRVLARLDYVSRPGRRQLCLDGPDLRLDWDVLSHAVVHVDAQGQRHERTYADDADRNAVMARQARALLEEDPGSAAPADPAAPPTLAEALETVRLCDRARGTDPPSAPTRPDRRTP